MGLGSFVKGIVGSVTGGDLLSAGASIVGGLMSNSAARANTKAANQTSIELANTAHQREVADLRAAGLNPILSANSGAGVPSIAAPDTPSPVGGAVTSALQSRMLREQIKNMQQDTWKKTMESEAAQAQAHNLTIDGVLKTLSIPEAEAASKLYDSEYGTLLKGAEKVVPLAGGVVSSAKSLKNFNGSTINHVSTRKGGSSKAPKGLSNSEIDKIPPLRESDLR